jgi:hypothetical protein
MSPQKNRAEKLCTPFFDILTPKVAKHLSPPAAFISVSIEPDLRSAGTLFPALKSKSVDKRKYAAKPVRPEQSGT